MDRQRASRAGVAWIVSLFVALAMTALAVAVAPGAFFVITQEGEPVRKIEMPGFPGLLLLAGLFTLFTALPLAWLSRTGRFQLALVAVLTVGIQGAAYVAYELWEYHESPEFCVRTCHVMEPTYLTFAEPGHNQVMIAHLTNETAGCLDCHTGPGLGGQLDLMVTSARHVWKYWFTGDYDPDDLGGADAVGTVPDENCTKCHGDGREAELPKEHDRFKTQCAMCHSPHQTNATGYFFPDAILEKDDCSLCHRDKPLDFVQNPSGHSLVAKEDCRECHVTHGNRAPQDILGCTDAGCHDGDPANGQSLSALGHVSFDEDSCQTCHGGAHNLTAPDLGRLSQDCTTCHAGKALHKADLHGAIKGLDFDDCSTCHGLGSNAAGADPASRLGQHGALQCSTCHRRGNDVGAPTMQFDASSQSQVSWMRQRGAGYANWTGDGRGSHDPGSDCGQCHQPHAGDHISFPEGGCNDDCHTWLQPFDQAGFTGPAGTPVYRDTVRPIELLNRTKDLDGDGRDHKLIFEKWGCTGFCHNPAITPAIAEGWGVPMVSQYLGAASVEPEGLVPSNLHGYVSVCTDCHSFASPLGGPDDLHSTHIPFIQAEIPVDDTGRIGGQSCNYCHDTGPYPENLSGGCYNCHLSGHWPETVYWGADG